MSKRIEVGPENYSKILTTQRGVSLRYEYLRKKAESGKFLPDPPIILSPLPLSYGGAYEFHLYNGNTRFRIASDLQLLLNGLVVYSSEEIPEFERMTDDPDELERMLRMGLINLLWPNERPSDTKGITIVELLNELENRNLQA